MEDRGSRVETRASSLHSRSSIFNPPSSILDPRSSILDPRSSIQIFPTIRLPVERFQFGRVMAEDNVAAQLEAHGQLIIGQSERLSEHDESLDPFPVSNLAQSGVD